MDLIKFLVNCICCVTATAVKVDQTARVAEYHGCCLPIKCFLEIKSCYDQCDNQVGVEPEVQMSGAPAAESMA